MSETKIGGENQRLVELNIASSGERRDRLNQVLGDFILSVKRNDDREVSDALLEEVYEIRDELAEVEEKIQTTQSSNRFPN